MIEVGILTEQDKVELIRGYVIYKHPPHGLAPKASPSNCASGLATMSVGPPAGNGTTSRIVLPANPCAQTPGAPNREMAPVEPTERSRVLRFTVVPK